MQVTASGNFYKDASINSTGSQSQIEQLQQQVAQMANFMEMMMNNTNKQCSTPEDHLTNVMAGLACSMMSYSTLNQNFIWVIDTCASHHMCCDKTLFSHISATPQPIHIALPNNHILKVDHIGAVILTPDITLINVLFVPDFNCNLLSVSKFITT